MKKIIFTLLAIFSLGIVSANAYNDRIIAKENLPQKSQQFINNYFGDSKITYIKKDSDFLDKSYEVMFADGSKVEFNRNGEWKDVVCRNSSVPTQIVPAKITNYVNTNFPDAKIVQIEEDWLDYEIKLSNGLEITFYSIFNIIDIDD